MTEMEDEFWKNCAELDVKLKCPNGHKFSSTIAYGGIVAQEEREMSDEFLHVWNNDEVRCPGCHNNKELTVELEFWEYPIGCPNHASFQNSECEVLNKEEISNKIGLVIE